MTITAPLDYSSNAITLYGNMDIGPTYVSNVGGKRKFYLDSSVSKADRFGILGREYLGSGMSAVFRLETEYFMNGSFQLNGSKNPGFTGQDFVGISSKDWGTVTLGRQFGVINDVASFSTIVYGSIYSSHHAAADLTGKDSNNSIKYQSPAVNGLRFTTLYGFSDPDNSLGRAIQAGITYAYGNFAAAVAYQQVANITESPYAGFSVTRFLGMPVTATSPSVVINRLTVYGVGAGYQIGPVRLVGEFADMTLKKGDSLASMPTYDIGAVIKFGPATTVGIGAERSTLGSACWTQYSLGAYYALSKTTLLDAFLVFNRASGTAAFAREETVGNSSSKQQLVAHFGILKYF
nr:porin [Caballeronia sp. ATUFL_M1_KS5A]